MTAIVFFATEQAWRALCRQVEQRDRRMCRVCHRSCHLTGKGKWKADPHHIVFRSAGGRDEPKNVILLCRSCHDDIHVHGVLAVRGYADVRLFVERLIDGRWVDQSQR